MDDDDIVDQIRRARRGTIEPVFRPMRDQHGYFFIEIPGEGSAGMQKFRGLTLEDLCSALAKSVFYGTNKIRRLMQIIKDQDGSEAEKAAEAKFYANPANQDF